jgi:hypothetical protein
LAFPVADGPVNNGTVQKNDTWCKPHNRGFTFERGAFEPVRAPRFFN